MRKHSRAFVLQAVLLGVASLALAAETPARYVLYSSKVYQPAGESYAQLWQISLPDGQSTQLSDTERDHRKPLCSPGGQNIAFVSGAPGRNEIWLFDRGTGVERFLAKFPEGEHWPLGWSADGSELFLEMYERGTDTIAKLSISGGQLVRLPEGSIAITDAERRATIIQAKGVADLPRGADWTLSPDGERAAYTIEDSAQLRAIQSSDGKELASISLPEKSEHWNYLATVSWSPNGNLIIVGSEAGSSTSHYEDYWLLNLDQQTWQYIGAGSQAEWSPDASEIVWSTPRELTPLGKMQVWVSHLALVEVPSFQRATLTSGTSYDYDFSWCLK